MSFYTPANLLTLARMPLALGLLFTAPLSPSALYAGGHHGYTRWPYCPADPHGKQVRRPAG